MRKVCGQRETPEEDNKGVVKWKRGVGMGRKTMGETVDETAAARARRYRVLEGGWGVLAGRKQGEEREDNGCVEVSDG